MLSEQAWALIRVTQTSGPRMWSAALQRTVTEDDGQELSKLRTSVQTPLRLAPLIASLVFSSPLSLSSSIFLSIS